MAINKVDYQSFDDDTTEFIARLKRVMADISLRLNSLEGDKDLVAHAIRQLQELGLVRIDAAVSPVVEQAKVLLAEAQTLYDTLANSDQVATQQDVAEAMISLRAGVSEFFDTFEKVEDKFSQLDIALAGKASANHAHIMTDVTGLDAAIALQDAAISNSKKSTLASPFIITDGSSNELVRITPEGYVQKPNIPAALVYGYSSAAFSTGFKVIGKSGDLANTTIVSNNGSHFNTATGFFTAPVDGFYYVDVQVSVSGGTAHNNRVSIMKNGSDITPAQLSYYNAFMGVGCSAPVYANEGDTLSGVSTAGNGKVTSISRAQTSIFLLG